MKDKVALGSSIIAAIAASLCCLGPLVAVVLGLGAFGAAATFETLRPYLLGATALLLAGAFYLTYRKREVRCEDGTCKTQGAGRVSKIMLWLATVVVVTFAAFPYYSGALLKASTQNPGATPADATGAATDATGYKPGEVAPQTSQPARARLATVVIGVEGMTCGSCATAVRLALEKVNGVNSADVILDKKEAKVVYDPAVATLEQLKAAIEAAGFKPTETKHTSTAQAQPKSAISTARSVACCAVRPAS